MPEITYLSWNIQHFGENRDIRGNYVALCKFIAQVAKRADADIIAIMELQQAGVPHLATLRAALDAAYSRSRATWQYDWIHGAITDGHPAGAPVNAATDLGWTQSANREGYAIFWKSNSTKFRMLPARNPGAGPSGVLSLVLEGRTTLPRSANQAYVAGAGWGELNFPIPVSNNAYRNASRRPAYCVIELNPSPPLPAQAQNLLPILVYHAPSGINGSAVAGTNLAAFSRPLFEVDSATPPAAAVMVNAQQALISGDFNVDTGDNFAWVYDKFTEPQNNGGAGMSMWLEDDNAHINATTVQLRQGVTGPPIDGTRTTQFLSLAIDNVFYRGLDEVNPQTGRVFDVLTAMLPGGSLTGARANRISPFAEIMEEISDADLGAEIQDKALFRREVKNGLFRSARTAAEFYRTVVSDHLPVVFKFAF